MDSLNERQPNAVANPTQPIPTVSHSQSLILDQEFDIPIDTVNSEGIEQVQSNYDTELNHSNSSVALLGIEDAVDSESTFSSLDIISNCEYDIPEPSDPRSPNKDDNTKGSILKDQLNELHAIFTTFGATHRLRNSLLRFMKKMHPTTQINLPLDCRTLRPSPIPHILRSMQPGRFVYFGIKNVLSIPELKLFDPSSTEIRMSLNIDGLPLVRSANGIEFWPLLASIESFGVFIIGAYEGRKKPICSNDLLRDFVDEVKQLQKSGLYLNNKMYRFRLHMICMDAPARAFIIGVKGHSGYFPCHKCHIEGTQVELPNISRNINEGKKRKRLCFTDTEAPPRDTKDFSYYLEVVPEPHDCYFQNIQEENGRVEYNLVNEPVADISVLSDEEEVEEFDYPSPNEEVRIRKFFGYDNDNDEHHQHPTILAGIDSFDLVNCIPLDYMHLICVGVMSKLLHTWDAGPFKMSKKYRDIVSGRLEKAKVYTPMEFQRKPESLTYLSSWKATQFRMFLLYLGVPVLHDVLNGDYLQNFEYLVYAMRCMAKKIDKTHVYSNILNNVGNLCRDILQEFVKNAIHLYGPTFAVYNVHSIIHMPDDYIRFGPIDQYSCFKYESFLGHIKSLIRGNFRPLNQLINQYSSLLYTNYYAHRANNQSTCVEEYFESPELKFQQYELGQDDFRMSDVIHECKKSHTHSYHSSFKEIKFKNFTIRTDNEQDNHCFIGNQYFVTVQEIIRDEESSEIFMIGRYFTHKESLFKLPFGDSEDVGIAVCSKLSTNRYCFSLQQLDEKCFAIPLESKNYCAESKWVFARFLH